MWAAPCGAPSTAPIVPLALGCGEEDPAKRAAELKPVDGGQIPVPPSGLCHVFGRHRAGDGHDVLEPATRPPATAGGGRGEPPLPASTLFLIAALTAAVVQQGAYYWRGQAVVATLLGLSVLLAVADRTKAYRDLRLSFWALVLLAAWALVRGALAGDPLLAAGTVALVLGLLAVVAVSHRTGEREVLALAVVAVGAQVALTGWVGVVWRISPLAHEDQGLWRAATTVTYPNAAAGLLAPLALLALGRSAGLRNRVWSVASWALLVGVGATLSRAGVLALAVGLVALAVLLRPAGALSVLLGPAAGALIALAGLLPSVPVESSPRPLLAVVALLAGLAVAVGMATVRVPTGVVLLAAALGVGELAVAATGADAVGSIRKNRLVLTSSDRARELIAALDIARHHPVAGVGPGRARLEWTGPDGGPLRARYAHNEYVQVLAELGVVGLGLLLVALSAAARVVVRSAEVVRSRPIWMGASAGLVALAVGSAFDFLWHVPAVPLVGALLFGLATPHPDCAAPAASPQPSNPTEKEQPCA